MQQYIDTVTTAAGAAVSGASVLVKNYPADTTATIYSDDGVTPQSNPMTTDALGRFSFYALDGRYSLVISKPTVITQLTLTDSVLLADPADATTEQDSADVFFTQSGTGAESQSLQRRMRKVVFVTDFIPESLHDSIADGSNATNLTTYILAAINYLGALGGGILYFPIGTYLVSNLVFDWCHVILWGQTSGYDYEGTTTQAVKLSCTTGTYAVHIKGNSSGGQHAGKFSGLRNIAISGTTEYGLVITSGATVLDDVTIDGGFTYGLTALNQNQNKYNRVSITDCTGIGACFLDRTNVALTAPNLTFTDIGSQGNTIWTMRDCNIRANVVGVVIREGNTFRFADCVIESNTQYGILIYKPTGVTITGPSFENVWAENNYTAYTSGSAAYSLTGILPLLATAGHYLTGSVNGDWGSVADAGYQLWIGAQTETVPASFMYFRNCNFNAGAADQRYAKLRACSFVEFYGGQWKSGDATNGLSIDGTHASYTSWIDFNANNTNVTAITGAGPVGGNRSFIMRRGENAGESGGWRVHQGVLGLVSGTGIEFASSTNILRAYIAPTAWTPAISGSSSAGAGTYTTQRGRYARIGDVVFFDVDLIWTAHTGTGNITITGWPININTTVTYSWSVQGADISLTAGNVIHAWNSSATVVNLRQVPSGGGSEAAVPMDAAGTLRMTGMYFAA